MPAGPRVWVFGAARSGNTLLNQLLAGFGLVTMPGETCLGRLLAHPSTGVVAGKRTLHCARHLPEDPVLDGVTVLHLVRDPRDVVTSRLASYEGYYCGLERWVRDENAIAAHLASGVRVITLRFEDVVTDTCRCPADAGDGPGCGRRPTPARVRTDLDARPPRRRVGQLPRRRPPTRRAQG